MGLLDGLRSILGVRAERDAGRDADPEDLFGMSTAYVTMEAELGYDYDGEAALCFSGASSNRFASALEEVTAMLDLGAEETGTEFAVQVDDHGYQWVVLRDADPEDAITSLHFAADEFVEQGFGSRLLAALFAFRDRGGGPVYWVYSFRRGAFYPFVPGPDRERDTATEFSLESHLDGELEIEPEKEYWHPLWPDRPGAHPWE